MYPTPIDHKARALELLITQYKESPNLINYLLLLLTEADTLEEVFRSLNEDRYLEKATGVNLDILGVIVGQDRIQVDADTFFFFGFAPHPQSQTFGSLTDPTIGGRFRSHYENVSGFRPMTDEEYRAAIRARIAKNGSTCTAQDYINQLRFLFRIDTIIVQDGPEAEFFVEFGRILTATERLVINTTDLLPKPAGVTAHYRGHFDGTSPLAFAGFPNAKPLGAGVLGALLLEV